MNLPHVRPAVQALTEAAIATRRELHRHAELSTEEWHTQGVILSWLNGIGADDVRAVADTGATAIIRGALPGPNLLWRADTDGLPLEEETGLAFASESEKAMHACGHDGHVAIALAMASALQERRASLAGTVRLAFQPAEEHVGGARRMIAEGIMQSPAVDRVFGLHIWASAPVGRVLVVPGAVFAAATHFRIIITGRGGHASAPHQTVDPIVVAAHAVVALQTVVSRSVNPEETAVFTIGKIQGGVRGNIIPNEVMMSGTIRTFEKQVLERMLVRIDEILRGVTSAWGGGYRFDHSTIPAVVNDAACAALVQRVAGAFLGPENVGEGRTTGADDMAAFLEAAPGAYFMLGGGNAARGITWPHHHPKFDFDEDCLPLGIELGLRIIEEASGSKPA
ncbi:MAG: amidohydrolase [Chloroflexi bacterium]|nr:amidohydrolase [Chloroflexota bacterium]